MAADDYAIVVGISRYPGISDLKGPENDARAFQQWLEAADGGQVPQQNITLVLSPSDDLPDVRTAIPTPNRIDAEFERLIDIGADNADRAGRRLYMFFAGHGFGPTLEDSALLTANADAIRQRLPHVSGRTYSLWFRTAAYFDEVVLIMDCCRDDYPDVPPHMPPWPKVRNVRGASVRYFHAFATSWARKSKERLVADRGGVVHGIFTAALLSALERAEPDADGNVTGAALKRYILNYMPHLLREKEKQEPMIDPGPGEDIVFVKRDTFEKTRLTVTFGPASIGSAVRLLDPPEVVAEHTGSADPWIIDVRPGLYKLESDAASTAFRVIGERTDVTFPQP